MFGNEYEKIFKCVIITAIINIVFFTVIYVSNMFNFYEHEVLIVGTPVLLALNINMIRATYKYRKLTADDIDSVTNISNKSL